MLNLKKTPSRREASRDIRDDLSIVTSNSMAHQRQPGSLHKRSRLNSLEETKHLKEHLVEAREQAIKLSLNTQNNVAKNANLEKITGQNEDKGDQQPPPENSTPVTKKKSSEITIKNLPSLISATQTRAAISQRKALQPIQANHSLKTKGSEIEYWSQFTSTGKYSRGLRRHSQSQHLSAMTSSQRLSKSSSKSSWTASCGFPIKRDDVSLVQSEVASLANASSTSTSSTPLNATLKSLTRYERNGRNPGGHLLPWMCRSVQPPPTTGDGKIGTTSQSASIIDNQTGPAHGRVMQGKWISRETLKAEQASKKYLIAELVDILCGDTVSTDSGLTSQIFSPLAIAPDATRTDNSSNFDLDATKSASRCDSQESIYFSNNRNT